MLRSAPHLDVLFIGAGAANSPCNATLLEGVLRCEAGQLLCNDKSILVPPVFHLRKVRTQNLTGGVSQAPCGRWLGQALDSGLLIISGLRGSNANLS